MKKTLLSPICSALIVPGLGQVINGNLKKGLVLLAMVFLLLLGAALRLVFLVQSFINDSKISTDSSPGPTKTLQGEDFSFLVYFVVPFAMIWVYSVFDAFWAGKKLESEVQIEDNPP